MMTWKELDAAFRELSPQLRESRVDVQWGAAGIHCKLAGWAQPPDRHRFETLAGVAGQKLRQHPTVQSNTEIMIAHTDFDAWALRLKNLTRVFKFGVVGEQFTESGASAGFLYTGSIDSPADSSANLCLDLDAENEAILGRRPIEVAQSSGASEHLRKAYGFFQSDPPDRANGAKEAVSALEAIACFVCGKHSATLGECLKYLRKERRINSMLVNSLEKVWGFVNQSPGVRHGSHEPPTLSAAEAQFVLNVSEAGIQLLLATTKHTP